MGDKREEELLGYFEKEMQKKQLEQANMEVQQSSLSLANQHQMMEDKSEGIVKEQLSLGDELKRIDYLLRSYTIEVGEGGSSKWVPPKNDDMVILSDYGVHVIREMVAWYLNKNTLLSNYDEDMINLKMRYIAKAFNKLIFMNYNKIFKTPTIDRCYDILQERLQDKVKIKMFARQLAGLETDEAQYNKDVIRDMEESLERELDSIKNQIFKDKLKRFPTLLRFIQDSIHSTYLRSLGGQERRSLRQHMQITETTGGIQMPALDNQKGGIMPWSKKR